VSELVIGVADVKVQLKLKVQLKVKVKYYTPHTVVQLT